QSAKEATKIATDYKDMIEKARKHFQEEIEALLPDAKFGEQGELRGLRQKLSEDELNLLVAHAHRRVELLTKALAKMQRLWSLAQVTEQERAQMFQRQQERANRDLERQRAEIDATLEVKLENQKEAFEQELQQQLRRQVAAHTEHLKEALEDQRHDLDRAFGQAIERKIIEERSRHNAALAASVAKLQGMEGYLKGEYSAFFVWTCAVCLSQQAKGLWLACQGLKQTLVYGHTSREGPQPLAQDVQPVREAAPMSPYVPLVLASIPEEALSRGVYPEVALKERFAHVEQVCRRVALVDERGGSLFRYLASYLQSLFIVYPKELLNEQRVNPEMWDTFDVLSRVRYWLLHEDLEQALRYATQLRGEPRQVARDWIREVRLHLEAKQAATALMAFAAATIAEDVQ
ncbi:transmembrane protein, putative, partial [Ixodes scapularis]